jgi:hypothetical protein
VTIALSVTGAGHDERPRVMGETIEGRTGQETIPKNLWPFLEGPIARDANRTGFVPARHDLVQIVDRGRGEGT